MSLLSVQKLGKSFRSYRSELQRFARWFGIPIKPSEEHWVLRHISFDIQPGEAIGIIGKNGAGKSTLLKMITGTLQPTEGHIMVNGRIAAILELGMGFNPELTGRQNVFHAAGLMGFSAEQIKQTIPDIEAFAEIGEYFDQPVRTYSSGMQARLAFAVATADRPEILIVDEALSVGDAAFQRKCFRRIEAFQSEGTTLLLVSHDIETIKKLCDKALFVKKGQIAGFGTTKSVCDEYEKYLFGGEKSNSGNGIALSSEDKTVPLSTYDPGLETQSGITYGDSRATIIGVWIENKSGDKVNTLPSGEKFSVNYIFEAHQPLEDIIFSTMIKTREGVAVYGTDTTLIKCALSNFNSSSQVHVSFQLENHLAPGIYYLNCGIRDDSQQETVFLCRCVDIAIFKVISSSKNTVGTGLVELQSQIQVWEKTNAKQ